MIDKNAKAAADRFMKKLTEKSFVMSRSKNSGDNYSKTKQARDSNAVAEFTKTEIFKEILRMS